MAHGHPYTVYNILHHIYPSDNDPAGQGKNSPTTDLSDSLSQAPYRADNRGLVSLLSAPSRSEASGLLSSEKAAPSTPHDQWIQKTSAHQL